jgi:hypothetical protein
MSFVQLMEESWTRRNKSEMVESWMGGVIVGLNMLHIDTEGDAGQLEELSRVIEQVRIVP